MADQEIEEIYQALKKRRRKHLILSLLIDVLGMATYVIPVLGEFADVVWAPISGSVIYAMYRRKGLPGIIASVVGGLEELLPGTDIIPTATLMWLYTYVIQKESTVEIFYTEYQKKNGKVAKF